MSEQTKEEKTVKTGKPLVFISHDTRDAELAEAFSNLLKKVSAGVLKSFRSSDKKGTQGIEFGTEWYPKIIDNIKEASDVVCLLTKHSVDRPWILFEAGMAKGKLDTPILGVALGIHLKKASTGPFAQFQNCDDDEDSLTKLVFQLVDRIPNSEPDEETIKFHVNNFKTIIKDILQKQVDTVPETEQELNLSDNSSVRLFEEIKVMFQDLPSRIENNIRVDYKRDKERRFHPMMIDELCHMSKNPISGIMIALSFFKETSMPWIYDLGMDLLRQIRNSKSNSEKEMAIREFSEVIEMTTHHPIMRKSFKSKDEHMMFREMPHILIKNIERVMLDE